MGSENFLEEFDFLEKCAVTEIFRVNVINEKGEIFRQNQGQHPDVACVLAVALVQAEKAVAFAAKETDGIDDLDAIEDRCPLTQTGKLLVSDSIDTRHQIDHSERRLL
jgi:hypothetical protein